MGRGDPRRAADPRPAGVRAVSTAASSHPGRGVETDEQILDWVARDAETALHPSCTARMGADDGLGRRSRDDARCTAIDGLRVVDASVFPYVTNGNIYAPVMMVAEKAADLIRGNTPLPPEPLAVLPPRRVAAARGRGSRGAGASHSVVVAGRLRPVA